MILTSEGPTGLLSAAVAALKPLDFHIFVKCLPSESDLKPIDIPQIEGLRLYEGDEALNLVRKLRKPGLANEFFRDELGATKCWLVLIRGKLASVYWAYPPDCPRPLLRLGDNDWELTGAYTAEEFRGLGLFRLMLRAATRTLYTQGLDHVWTIVASDNPSSLKGVREFGYIEAGRLRRPALFGSKFDTSTYSPDGS